MERMSREILLRDYRPTDLDAMFQLDEACFAEEFRFDRESMREFAEERSAIIRIAELDGGIEGFVIVHIKQVASERRAYVVTLDVAASHRRQGLARRLMNEVEALAASAGAEWMQLHVFTGNMGAIRFYERMGYEPGRLRCGYYGAAGLDAILYAKRLQDIL
jgi:[ribosomal protein S18]-alanine N-acetyltransferase